MVDAGNGEGAASPIEDEKSLCGGDSSPIRSSAAGITSVDVAWSGRRLLGLLLARLRALPVAQWLLQCLGPGGRLGLPALHRAGDLDDVRAKRVEQCVLAITHLGRVFEGLSSTFVLTLSSGRHHPTPPPLPHARLAQYETSISRITVCIPSIELSRRVG